MKEKTQETAIVPTTKTTTAIPEPTADLIKNSFPQSPISPSKPRLCGRAYLNTHKSHQHGKTHESDPLKKVRPAHFSEGLTSRTPPDRRPRGTHHQLKPKSSKLDKH